MEKNWPLAGMNEKVKCCTFSFYPYPPNRVPSLISYHLYSNKTDFLTPQKMMGGVNDWLLLEIYYLHPEKAVEKSSISPSFLIQTLFWNIKKLMRESSS